LVLAGFHDLAFGWSSMMDDMARGLHHPEVPNLDDQRVLFFVASIAALLIATALYSSAYLSYDRMLMPTRFWAAGEPPDPGSGGIVWRPPSSSLLVLHQNMQRVWFRAFIPATLFTGFALVGLAYASIIQQLADTLGNAHAAQFSFATGLGVLLVVLAGWLHWARPLLGAQD
jgi:hypothetical protein